jgi:hypothetical protein
MKTIATVRILPLLFALFLCGCASTGPSAADVAADRARWTAVRMVTADGVVDRTTVIEPPNGTEASLLSELLVEWDDKLAGDEAAASQPRTAASTFDEIVRVYGAAAVEVFLVDEVARAEKRYPEAFRLIDKNGDRAITIDELRAVDPMSPVFALVVASTAKRLLKR